MERLNNINNNSLTHIIGIADLHVRTGDREQSRSHEYNHVFDNFIDDIGTLQCIKDETAVIILAGDVFHNKGRIETAGMKLVLNFMNRLLNMAPVLVIAGNHDFRQENPAYMDTIEMLIAAYEFSSAKFPLHYLQRTGHYLFNDIGIGMCSVKETLRKFNTSGITSDLPAFPNPNVFKSVSCRVALFHGSISQSALPNGRSVDSIAHGYPLEWFKGYDIAVLGDNHKQQLHLDDFISWGYPGSLIQQDHGEPILGHGYLLWDVASRSAEVKHINNQYGHVTIIRTNINEFLVRIASNDLISLAQAAALKNFPKMPRVRMVNCAGFEKFVSDTLNIHGIYPSFIKTIRAIGSTEGGGAANSKSETTQLQDVNSPEQWEAYMRLNKPEIEVSNWIYKPETLLIREEAGLPSEIIAKIRLRNKTLQQNLSAFEAAMHETSTKYTIILKQMEWSYLMCFGPTNHFDFESCDTISLLNGVNASGKSSFLDVLCIAIFGEPTSSRFDTGEIKQSGISIIHNDKPVSKSSGVTISFTLNGSLFEIQRTFTKYNDTRQSVVTAVNEITENGGTTVAEGSTMVSEWVKRRFGTLNEFLMSSVICQMDNKSFFYQGSVEQKNIIDKALNLDMLKLYQDYLDEARKAYKYIALDLSTYIDGFEKGMPASSESLTAMRLRLETNKVELDGVTSEIDAYSEKTKSLLKKLGEDVDADGDEEELDEEDTKTALTVAENALKRLSQQRIIPNLSKTSLLVQQGVLNSQLTALREEQRLAAFSDIEFNQKMATRATKALVQHDKKQPPESSVTRAYVAQKQTEYKSWFASSATLIEIGKPELITRTAALELEKTALEGRLYALNEQPVVQPAGIVPTLVSSSHDELQKLRIKMEESANLVSRHAAARPREVANNREKLEKVGRDWSLWSKRQNPVWLADPAAVAVLAITHARQVADAERDLDCATSRCVAQPAGKRPTATAATATTLLEYQAKQAALMHAESESHTPERPKTGLKKWLQELAEWHLLKEKLPEETSTTIKQLINTTMDDMMSLQKLNIEKVHLTDAIGSLTRDIAVLEPIASKPFNGACAACIKNQGPARAQLEEKQLALVESETRLKKLIQQIAKYNAGKLEELREQYAAKLAVRERYDQNSKRMEGEIRAWAAADDQWSHQELLLTLRMECTMLSWTMWESWTTERATLKAERENAFTTAEQSRQFVAEIETNTLNRERAAADLEALGIFEVWQQQYVGLQEAAMRNAGLLWNCWRCLRINLQEQLMIVTRRLQELKMAVYWSDEKAKVDVQDQELSTWDAWSSGRTRQAHEVAHWAWLKKLQSVQTEAKKVASSLAEMLAFEQAEEQVSMWRKALLRIEYRSSSEQLEALREQAEILLTEVATQEKSCEQILALAETSTLLNNAKANFLNIHERVMTFYDVFVGTKTQDGFKTTLYKSKVIPLIEGKVNSFIAPIEDIRLRIAVKNGKFVYSAEDRGNTPPFDNCSGYQKFIMGLGVRCALAEIGAVGQSVKHMFMDESFVACDSTNILKVRDILDELVRAGNYKSIIIMSHLDAIREVTSRHINIQRDSGKFSSIQFGRVYPKLKRGGKNTSVTETTETTRAPKARGRPRKTK